MAMFTSVERSAVGLSRFERLGQERRVLLVWSSSSTFDARVRVALSDEVRVETTTSLVRACAILEENAEATALIEVPIDADGEELRNACALLKSFPHTPSIAAFIARSSHPAALAKLAAIRLAEILVVDELTDRQAIMACVLSCQRATLARRVWQEAGLALDDDLETLLVRALRLAAYPISLPRYARETGMPERSLRKYCLRRGFPSPQWLIGWSRILVASHFLDEPGRTIDGIARLLGYASPSALRNQLKRYTGHTASELRVLGAVRTASHALREVTSSTGVELESPRLRLLT